jgi:pilus assembly protein FimV
LSEMLRSAPSGYQLTQAPGGGYVYSPSPSGGRVTQLAELPEARAPGVVGYINGRPAGEVLAEYAAKRGDTIPEAESGRRALAQLQAGGAKTFAELRAKNVPTGEAMTPAAPGEEAKLPQVAGAAPTTPTTPTLPGGQQSREATRPTVNLASAGEAIKNFFAPAAATNTVQVLNKPWSPGQLAEGPAAGPAVTPPPGGPVPEPTPGATPAPGPFSGSIGTITQGPLPSPAGTPPAVPLPTPLKPTEMARKLAQTQPQQ